VARPRSARSSSRIEPSTRRSDIAPDFTKTQISCPPPVTSSFRIVSVNTLRKRFLAAARIRPPTMTAYLLYGRPLAFAPTPRKRPRTKRSNFCRDPGRRFLKSGSRNFLFNIGMARAYPPDTANRDMRYGRAYGASTPLFLRRLRTKTRRPPGVWLLFKKPCVRRRFFFFGRYVIDITIEISKNEVKIQRVARHRTRCRIASKNRLMLSTPCTHSLLKITLQPSTIYFMIRTCAPH